MLPALSPFILRFFSDNSCCGFLLPAAGCFLEVKEFHFTGLQLGCTKEKNTRLSVDCSEGFKVRIEARTRELALTGLIVLCPAATFPVQDPDKEHTSALTAAHPRLHSEPSGLRQPERGMTQLFSVSTLDKRQSREKRHKKK